MNTVLASPAEDLDATAWRRAGQRLIERAIAEWLYEEILQPVQLDAYTYVIETGKHQYHYQAERRLLGHWQVKAGSVSCAGEPVWDLTHFLHAVTASLDMSDHTRAYLMREMHHTWIAESHLEADSSRVDELLGLAPMWLDGHLRGHPWIVMNKGRMGFGYSDWLRYAPERQQPVRLHWLAVHRDLADYHATPEWPAEQLYRQELGASLLMNFSAALQQRGLTPTAYHWLPVHPWQWEHWIAPSYAREILEGRLVYIGLGEDRYLPTQSIRTFANLDHSSRHAVKLPLNILNTAVYRGLPGPRNRAAPALSAWLKARIKADPSCGQALLLGEIATLTVRQPAFDAIPEAPYQFHELLGCLWRESIEVNLAAEQRVLSQAALLHRDAYGKSLLSALINRSGLPAEAWWQRFLEVCMEPLLYWLYRYGLVFSPHGENSLLIHRHGVPERLVLKDFIDDVNRVDLPFPELAELPAEVDAVLLRHAPLDLAHFIFTGLLLVHYRYIADVLIEEGLLSEEKIWHTAIQVLAGFHTQHPELAERASLFDLQRQSFEKICLNRVRLFGRGYTDAAERPVPAILAPIPNPLNQSINQQWREGVTP